MATWFPRWLKPTPCRMVDLQWPVVSSNSHQQFLIMAAMQASYRFSIRDLLIVTAGIALLLAIYKSQGLCVAGALTLTLVTGGLFLLLLSVRPIQHWKAPFAKCTLLTVGNVVLFIFGLDVIEGNFYWRFTSDYNQLAFAVLCLICLLTATLLIFSYAVLIKNSIRLLLSPAVILFQLLFVNVVLGVVLPSLDTRDSHLSDDLIYGYQIGLVALLVLLAIRWINALPTTREDAQEPFQNDGPET